MSEALHFAARSRTTHSRSPQLLMFADVGHGWASDKTVDTHYTVNEGLDFLDAIMLTPSPPDRRRRHPPTCPASAPSVNRATQIPSRRCRRVRSTSRFWGEDDLSL